MKIFHILIISILLSACNEKPYDKDRNETTTSTIVLSESNISDIEEDLLSLNSIVESPEIVNLQSYMNQRLDSEGNDGVASIFEYMKKTMEDSKRELVSTKFKSSEVSKIKDRLKESFEVNIKIADKLSKMELDENGQPVNIDDIKEMNDLKSKLNDISEELYIELQLIQTKLQELKSQDEMEKSSN